MRIEVATAQTNVSMKIDDLTSVKPFDLHHRCQPQEFGKRETVLSRPFFFRFDIFGNAITLHCTLPTKITYFTYNVTTIIS